MQCRHLTMARPLHAVSAPDDGSTAACSVGTWRWLDRCMQCRHLTMARPLHAVSAPGDGSTATCSVGTWRWLDRYMQCRHLTMARPLHAVSAPDDGSTATCSVGTWRWLGRDYLPLVGERAITGRVGRVYADYHQGACWDWADTRPPNDDTRLTPLIFYYMSL